MAQKKFWKQKYFKEISNSFDICFINPVPGTGG